MARSRSALRASAIFSCSVVLISRVAAAYPVTARLPASAAFAPPRRAMCSPSTAAWYGWPDTW